jgi:hypothetical protein
MNQLERFLAYPVDIVLESLPAGSLLALSRKPQRKQVTHTLVSLELFYDCFDR